MQSRVPARRAWERWIPELTHTTVDVDGVGVVESWHELIAVVTAVITASMIKFHADEYCDALIESWRRRCDFGVPDDVAGFLVQSRALIAVDRARPGCVRGGPGATAGSRRGAAYSGFLLFDASTGASAELRRTALWATRGQLARAIEVHP